MSMLKRRTLFAAPTLLAAPALAQSWPTRPVTMLVPFVAGGPSDLVARAITIKLTERIGQPVVAENRPGANGAVAAQFLARQAPDGHTLMVGSIGTYAINAAIRPTGLGYDPVRDLTPITLAVTTPNVLVVNPQRVAANTLGEFTEWLKRNGGTASYSTSGVGSSDQLTTELFKQRTGTEATHVPYQGGAAAATALLAGDVQLSFQNLGTVAAHIQGGRLKALAVTGRERHRVLPDVPTAIEAGLSDFDVTSWQAVMAPGNMPAALRDKVSEEVRASLDAADTRQRLGAIGLDVAATGAEDYAAFQRAEVERWREVVRVAGIRAE